MSKESLLTKIPDNISLLQTTQYIMTFPKMPFLKYFLSSAILPGVSTNAVMVPTGQGPTWRHGDTLNYDPLTVTCIADEDLKTWEETYNWLKGLTTPHNFNEYLLNHNINKSDFPRGALYSDAILTFTTNANNPNFRIHFKDCHPTYLGMIPLNNSDSGDNSANFDITFQYDTFNIER